MFDHGRQRELHIENAMAVANAGPADLQVPPNRLTNERTILVSSPHFMFEKFDLPRNSAWRLKAARETWLLVLGGGARTGSFDVATGDAVFMQADHVNIDTGATGLVGLLAYTGIGPIPDLLQCLGQPDVKDTRRAHEVRLRTSLRQATGECMGTSP
jgi:mannose-6-phosphate isomerase